MNGTDGINPDTGLPALPDGQWWEVVEDCWTYLKICERQSFEVTTPRWFGRARVEVRTKTDTVWAEHVTNDEGEPVFPTELTPELIRRTADKIMDRRARSEAGRALLGKYPPKRLGETK